MSVHLKSFVTLLGIFTSLISAPCEESYIIRIPKNLEITSEGSFDVSMIKNSLNDNQSVEIVFSDTITLSDKHGKDDVKGTISNNQLSFKSDDTNPKTINYHFDDIPVGEWQGNIDFTIELVSKAETNLLVDGKTLNEILQNIRPNYITFSHQAQLNTYNYDLSLAKDESILLYIIDDENIIITNNSNKPIKANQDMSYAFSNLLSLDTICNFDYIDFSDCISFKSMFEGCQYLENINGINNINTQNIVDISSIFRLCKIIKNTDFSNWDTSNITNMEMAFKDCQFESINVSSWDTSNVLNMKETFNNCTGLKTLDVSTWNVSKVNNMESLFNNCRSLTSLNLANWNPCACQSFKQMFKTCLSLTGIGKINNWDVSNCVNMSQMFNGCITFNTIGNLKNWNVSNVEDMSLMFRDCQVLTNIGNVSNWDVSNVKSFARMFDSTYRFMYHNYIANWNVSNNCVDLSYMFYNNHDNFVTDFDLSKWDVSSVKDMSYMFYDCYYLTNLNLSGWETSSLEKISGMFKTDGVAVQAHLTTVIGMDDFDTSNLIMMDEAFYNNKQVKNLDLSAWDISNVKDMSYAFYKDLHLELSQFENWTIPSDCNIEYIFGEGAGCLASPFVPSWYHE